MADLVRKSFVVLTFCFIHFEVKFLDWKNKHILPGKRILKNICSLEDLHAVFRYKYYCLHSKNYWQMFVHNFYTCRTLYI